MAKSAVGVFAHAITPAKPVAANLAKIPLTVAGLGCIDASFFLWSLIGGLVATGVTLMLVEHMIADDA